MEFKDLIKDMRLEKDLSQLQLAKKLNISQSAIAKWEIGKTEPTATLLKKLAKYFNVSSDYLLGLEDEFGNKIEN